MIFMHDYYFPPKDGETKCTVLCMRCAVRVRAPEMTIDQVKAKYHEKKMKWVNDNGVSGNGIIILCEECILLPIEDKYMSLVHRQVMKGLEDEAKWAKLPIKNNLGSMQIMNQEAA